MREKQAIETGRAGKHRAADQTGVACVRSRSRNGCRDARPRRRANSGDSSSAPAEHETHDAAEATQDKGDSPGEDRDGFRRQPRSERQAHAGGSRYAHGDAGKHDAAHKRCDPRSGFDDVGERAGQLAAKTEALHDPQRNHQRAGGDAPPLVRRHEPHARGCQRHDENRPEEHLAAPVAIAKVAEDDAADRAGEIAGRERGKRGHQRNERRAAGKKRVGNVAREDAENDEVVELQRAAEAGEQDDAPAARCHERSRRIRSFEDASSTDFPLLSVSAARAPASSRIAMIFSCSLRSRTDPAPLRPVS